MSFGRSLVAAAVVLPIALNTALPATEGSRATAAPIRIGLVAAPGPGGDALARGAGQAAEDVNAAGGVGGRPLQVVRIAPPGPWTDVATRTARLVFEEELVALIGPTDGAGAHAAAQVATRARIPLLTLSPEGSLTRAADPWVFRGVPDDGQQARAVLRWALDAGARPRAALVVPTGREGRERRAALQDACSELGVEVWAVISYPVVSPDGPAAGLERADLLLLWLDVPPATAFLDAMAGRGMPRWILGSSRLDTPEWPSRRPVRLVLPVLRPSRRPGGVAALGHDMVGAIAAAARRAGSRPDQLRRGLADGSTFRGQSGTFRFGRWGGREGAIPIGTLRRGDRIAPPATDRGRMPRDRSSAGPESHPEQERW